MSATNERELTGGDAFAALLARMVALQEQQAETLKVQNERTTPKEDPNYKARSIFLQESGEQWAKLLKCDIYFGPIHLNKTPLTQAEVDALNTLQPVEKARIEKLDGSIVLATVRPKEDAVGRLDRLTVEIPMKKDDNPNFLPGMVSLCTQLAAQYETVAA